MNVYLSVYYYIYEIQKRFILYISIIKLLFCHIRLFVLHIVILVCSFGNSVLTMSDLLLQNITASIRLYFFASIYAHLEIRYSTIGR